jgi:hypothetical protein
MLCLFWAYMLIVSSLSLSLSLSLSPLSRRLLAYCRIKVNNRPE